MIAMRYVLLVCFAVTVIGATATRSNNLLSAIVKNGDSIASRNLLSVQEYANTYNDVLYDECTAEDVNVIVEIKETYEFSYTDNTYHVSIHIEEHISGVGATTGATYHGVLNANINANVAAGVTYNYHEKYKLVTQDPNNNYNINYDGHFTINANGELTSSRNNYSITCK